MFAPIANLVLSLAQLSPSLSTFFYPDYAFLIQAVKKVRAALLGKDGTRMKDVPFMVGFTHTGAIGIAFAMLNIF